MDEMRGDKNTTFPFENMIKTILLRNSLIFKNSLTHEQQKKKEYRCALLQQVFYYVVFFCEIKKKLKIFKTKLKFMIISVPKRRNKKKHIWIKLVQCCVLWLSVIIRRQSLKTFFCLVLRLSCSMGLFNCFLCFVVIERKGFDRLYPLKDC